MYNSIKVKVYCKNKHNFINTRKIWNHKRK